MVKTAGSRLMHIIPAPVHLELLDELPQVQFPHNVVVQGTGAGAEGVGRYLCDRLAAVYGVAAELAMGSEEGCGGADVAVNLEVVEVLLCFEPSRRNLVEQSIVGNADVVVDM